MKQSLEIKTQNKKGGNPQFKKNLGMATIFLNHSGDFITADIFEGSGANYKQREQALISIFGNGAQVWQGTEQEFYKQLKK